MCGGLLVVCPVFQSLCISVSLHFFEGVSFWAGVAPGVLRCYTLGQSIGRCFMLLLLFPPLGMLQLWLMKLSPVLSICRWRLLSSVLLIMFRYEYTIRYLELWVWGSTWVCCQCCRIQIKWRPPSGSRQLLFGLEGSPSGLDVFCSFDCYFSSGFGFRYFFLHYCFFYYILGGKLLWFHPWCLLISYNRAYSFCCETHTLQITWVFSIIDGCSWFFGGLLAIV